MLCHTVRFKLAVLGAFVAASIHSHSIHADEDATTNSSPAYASPFGIGACHINNRSANDNSRWLPQMAEIGLKVMRTPQSSWSALEREKGQWDWTALDEQCQYLEDHGFEYDMILIGNPKWNKADPPGSMPVNNLDGWSEYVKQVVGRYKDRVHRYEIWNEPPNFTGKDQTPGDYANLVFATYEAAKSVDPDCQIGLAAKSAHVSYLRQTILAGGKDHFDYIVLHPYEVLGGLTKDTGAEAVYMNVSRAVRKMLADHNPAKVDVPIVFTELGINADDGEEVQANGLVKAYVMGIAQGISNIQWFEGRDGDSGPMGLLNQQGEPRKAYFAMEALIEHFGNDPQYVGWTLLNDRCYAFYFEAKGKPLLVTWGRPYLDDTVEFGGEAEIHAPVSGGSEKATSKKLGTEPLFIRDFPKEWLETAAGNRDKPFPWDGDYTEASEVSIEFGDTIVSRGLHTRSGAELAKAVVDYGGSAREGSVPLGNGYIVDPNFLCYDREPIEVTVVVRRNEDNVNSGFKLVYESPTGFKTAGGWYTVPDNTKWHTKTFRIDDPCFVNYWGFNFLLESDGNVFNKYRIKSVKVRKVDQDNT